MTQDEVLQCIRSNPGILQKELDSKLNTQGTNCSQVNALVRKKEIYRIPSKFSWHLYPTTGGQ